MTSLNGAGAANMRSKVSSGAVDKTSSWSFSAEDGNSLLGANGDNWTEYSRWHLGVHAEQPEKTKGHYGYPFGKGGKVYRSALIAIKQRAAQQGESDIEGAAAAQLDKIDAEGKSASRIIRAYATVEIRAAGMSDGKRRFTGVATTPSTDSYGDIVEPRGAQFNLPIPLLWQHDPHDPIGWVTAARVTDKGIEIDGEVADVPTAGALQQRLDMAWQMMQAKLVRGLSIGFNPLETAGIEGTRGYRYTKWKMLELSAVTIAANEDCSITAIRSVSEKQRAALGPLTPPKAPGASGQSTLKYRGTMKTLAELRDLLATKTARVAEIQSSWEQREYVRTDAERDELDQLADDIGMIQDDIRIARMHQSKAAGATPVSAGPTVFVRKADPDDKFQGQSYTRMLVAKAAAFIAMREGNYVSPADIAKQRWGKTHPKLVEVIRAAVAGGGTGSGEWGAELAQSDTRFTGDFIEFLYAQTVFDRLPLRAIPARVHVKGQDGAATGYWVGESKAIPVSKLDFSDVELTPLKVAAMAVCSKELIADSSPAAETFIRDSIAQASTERVDTTFLSAVAASAGVSPAGLLNGLSGIASSGADAAALRTDIMALYQPFLDAKIASGITLVMTPSQAKAISLLVNALGQTEFPGLTAQGGTLLGDPVVTGENVGGGQVIAIRSQDVWRIGDGGLDVSMSDQAMIEQNDAPLGASDTPTAASATLMSMWQTESVAFKVVRRINYAKRRTAAVAFLTGVSYGGVAS